MFVCSFDTNLLRQQQQYSSVDTEPGEREMVRLLVLSCFALVALLSPTAMSMSLISFEAQGLDLCQSVEGRNVDVVTQKGGKGNLVPSPPFFPAEEVVLYANVTYNEWPEQNSYVAFQIFDVYRIPFILSGTTNASGIATTRFCLPSAEHPEDIFGNWRVVASVNIADVAATDALEFHVSWNLADVNLDLTVDIYDAVLVCGAYGYTSSDSCWNFNYDISEPYGTVDLYDAVTVLVNYGKRFG